MIDVPESAAAESDRTLEVEPSPSPCEPSTATSRFGEWYAFLTAVQFLTRIPICVPDWAITTALPRCPIYFPLVGGLIGVITAAMLGLASQIWPVWLAVIAALALEACVTGAFHEDAVADFCDGFGGGWTREDVLRIMKDSRIGSFGTMGLGLAVALRAGATMEIVHQAGRDNWLLWSAAIVGASAIGRWVIVILMVVVPPITSRESLSRDIGTRLAGVDLLAASLWMLPVVLPFFIQSPVRAAISLAVLFPIVCWFASLVRRRIGGTTGDCLGFICYCSTVAVLLVASARWQG